MSQGVSQIFFCGCDREYGILMANQNKIPCAVQRAERNHPFTRPQPQEFFKVNIFTQSTHLFT